jgi:hypothetical protein
VKRWLRKPRNTGKHIESGVETQDSRDSMLGHDGEMNSVAGREPLITENNLFGALDRFSVDWENIINDVRQRVEGELDIVVTSDRRVTVKNFLKNFCVCNQPLPLAYQTFHNPL